MGGIWEPSITSTILTPHYLTLRPRVLLFHRILHNLTIPEKIEQIPLYRIVIKSVLYIPNISQALVSEKISVKERDKLTSKPSSSYNASAKSTKYFCDRQKQTYLFQSPIKNLDRNHFIDFFTLIIKINMKTIDILNV